MAEKSLIGRIRKTIEKTGILIHQWMAQQLMSGYWFQKNILDQQLMSMLPMDGTWVSCLAGKKLSGFVILYLRIKRRGKSLMWRMIIGFLRNHGQELIYIRDQYCKSVNFLFSEIFINQVSIFPPSTIHVRRRFGFLWWPFLDIKDYESISTSPWSNRSRSESNEWREKRVFFFQFLENFIGETLKISKPELTKRQLKKFVVKFVVTLEKLLGVGIARATWGR